MVYNLEDFLETIEDKLSEIQTGIKSAEQDLEFGIKNICFVPTRKSESDLEAYLLQKRKPFLSRAMQFFNFKYRRLKGFTEVVLNTN